MGVFGETYKIMCNFALFNHFSYNSGGVQRRCVSATSWEQGEAKLCAAMSLPLASHAPEEERSDDVFRSDSDKFYFV